MTGTRTAKLFKNGASQAVRLPAEFRFKGEEVYVRRDEATGDVILSSRPSIETWQDFFAAMKRAPAPKDFMEEDFIKERPMNRPPVERNLFEDEA